MVDLTGPVSAATEARVRLTAASVELWNVRLESLVERGDLRALLDHLARPLESGCDNCSCNQGCNSCLQALQGQATRPGLSR